MLSNQVKHLLNASDEHSTAKNEGVIHDEQNMPLAACNLNLSEKHNFSGISYQNYKTYIYPFHLQ